MSADPVPADFLELLRCPESRQPLAIGTQSLGGVGKNRASGQLAAFQSLVNIVDQ